MKQNSVKSWGGEERESMRGDDGSGSSVCVSVHREEVCVCVCVCAGA